MNSIEQRTPYSQKQNDPIFEWVNATAERTFKARFPKEDESFSRELVKEYNNVDAPAAFVKCKDAIFLIIGDERTTALNSPSFSSADHYLAAVKDSADIIESELGKESNHYKNICNKIVNTYISVLINTVWINQTASVLKEASKRAEKAYSYYPISESTKQRISQTISVFAEIEQEINHTRKKQHEEEKASRLSERIKRFALSHSSVDGGNKRYTTSGLAWLALIVYGFGCIISLFEWFFSLFKKKQDLFS